jgi:hypothetical protein
VKRKSKKGSDHKYKLVWKLDRRPGGVKKEDVPEGFGACDAVLFCSIIYPADGGLSIYFIGVDGRKDGEIQENLEDREWFKVWTLLSSRLAESKTLSPDRKNICREAFETMRVKLLGHSFN